MKTKNSAETIKKALIALGIKGSVRIERSNNENLWYVMINEKYFGIYDVQKNTFID